MKYEICSLGPLGTNLTCLPLYDPMKPHEPDARCLTQHSHCIENFFGDGASSLFLLHGIKMTTTCPETTRDTSLERGLRRQRD